MIYNCQKNIKEKIHFNEMNLLTLNLAKVKLEDSLPLKIPRLYITRGKRTFRKMNCRFGKEQLSCLFRNKQMTEEQLFTFLLFNFQINTWCDGCRGHNLALDSRQLFVRSFNDRLGVYVVDFTLYLCPHCAALISSYYPPLY
jgi:hypothetical protein